MRLDDRNPMSNSDVLLTVEGLQGYFSTLSGLEITAERPDWSDGLTSTKRKASSATVDYGEVTLSKAFDPDKDTELIEWAMKARCSIDTYSVTIQPVTRCNGLEQRGNKSWYLSGARVSKITPLGDLDTSDGKSVAMFGMSMTIDSAEWA